MGTVFSRFVNLKLVAILLYHIPKTDGGFRIMYIEKESTSSNGRKGIAFEVMDFKGERYAMVVRTDKQGRLIFWKSFHIQHDVQKKWKKINLAKLKQGLYKSVEGGQLSILRILGTSSSDLSAFPDSLSVPQTQKKSRKM